MGVCVDNPRLGITGCRASYGGEMQHSVARVPWGASADGRAHITGRLSTIDKCWTKGGVLRNPAEVAGLVQDDRGVWRQDMTAAQREALAAARKGQ